MNVKKEMYQLSEIQILIGIQMMIFGNILVALVVKLSQQKKVVKMRISGWVLKNKLHYSG